MRIKRVVKEPTWDMVPEQVNSGRGKRRGRIYRMQPAPKPAIQLAPTPVANPRPMSIEDQLREKLQAERDNKIAQEAARIYLLQRILERRQKASLKFAQAQTTEQVHKSPGHKPNYCCSIKMFPQTCTDAKCMCRSPVYILGTCDSHRPVNNHDQSQSKPMETDSASLTIKTASNQPTPIPSPPPSAATASSDSEESNLGNANNSKKRRRSVDEDDHDAKSGSVAAKGKTDIAVPKRRRVASTPSSPDPTTR
ncbi:hypothetical protein HDU76_012868 [Blyttiomyces sp. JEL0837]|nr:hypothetical protein HDU76_012868 [Blyttiomyces sp. JEL0837]